MTGDLRYTELARCEGYITSSVTYSASTTESLTRDSRGNDSHGLGTIVSEAQELNLQKKKIET